MKNLLILISILLLGVLMSQSYAEENDKHDHEKTAKHGDHKHSEDEHGHDNDKHEEDDHGHGEGDHKEGEHDHDEHGQESFGEGKAIVEVSNEGEKFKLSAQSEKFLGIITVSVDLEESGKIKISEDSLVRFQSYLGIFVKEDNWFKLIKVKVIRETEGNVLIESNQFQKNMQIVRSGVPLLRVAHLQATGQGGKGHAH